MHSPLRLGVCVALSIWLAAPAYAQTVSAKPIEAAVFADKPVWTELALSPDGARIAAAEKTADRERLIVFQASGADRKPVYYEPNMRGIARIDWAGSNKLIVTSTLTFSLGGITIALSNLSLLDLQTGKQRAFDTENATISAGQVLHIDPQGKWALVAAQKSIGGTPWVRRIELDTGASTIVEKARPNVWNWFADSAGLIRAGIAYDDDRWTVWYRNRAGAPLEKIRSPNMKGISGTIDNMYFVAGEDTGAIVTNAKSDRFAAYRFDFRSGEIGEVIYEHPQVDVTDIVPNPATRKIAGVSYEDDRARVAWLEPAMQIVQTRLDKALPGLDNRVIDRSADGNRLLIWSSSASDPGTYYLFDQAAKRMEAILKPHERLADVRLTPVKPIRYTARDGTGIPGYLTLPMGKPERDLPLILMPHGGPFARDHWAYDPFVQFLASRGYAVLQPNFRGSTGYGKRFVEQGFGQWGRKMQDDVDDGVDWLVKSGMVDPKRVCVMGTSYGGYVSLWGAIRNPEKYRCAVSLAGVTDLPGMLRYDRRAFNAPRYFRQWQDRVRGDSDTDLKALSPLAQAARMTVPVLIGHGLLDYNVPVEQAQKMVDTLNKRKNGQEVAWVVYKNEGHGLDRSENLADFLTRLETFLTRHNPADLAPPKPGGG